MAAIEQTVMYHIDKSIQKKAALFEKHYWAYALRSIYASVYLALGIAISLYTADKIEQVMPGLGKFSYGLMFGWGLLMILYMNAELGTSNMMYMTVAIYRKVIPPKTAIKILVTCIVFNAIGAILVCFLLAQTTPFSAGHVALDSYLIQGTMTKLAKSPLTQFVEGIFANMVVNIAVMTFLKMKEDSGKVLSVVFIIFIFAFLGFEHVIANFSTFSLAVFSSSGAIEGMNVGSVLSNFFFSGVGNYIGGGLLIGLVYSWLNAPSTDYKD